jgi:hypothetical protein
MTTEVLYSGGATIFRKSVTQRHKGREEHEEEFRAFGTHMHNTIYA